MPRNGSGVYSAPAGTLGTPNTVIESAKHNALVNDLVSDANAARPISAGGTGATSATAAQAALGVDGKVVYATKSAGYTAVAADNSAYLRFTAGATLALTAAATLGSGWHLFTQANGGAVVIDPNGAETVNGVATVTIPDGQSAYVICTGSAFLAIFVPGIVASALNSNGTVVLRGSSGELAGGDITTFRPGSPTSGAVYFGNTTTKYLYFDGTTFILSGGNLTVGATTYFTTGDITFSGSMASTFGASLSVALTKTVVKRSGQLTPSLGGTLTYAHGLSYTPDEYWAEMECTTADAGWAIGNIIRAHVDDNGGGYGVEVYRDGTNVYGVVGANGIGQTHNKSTGASVTLTTASWRVRLCAR